MTAWMRARVASCTSGDWLMTRETVFFETLARRAMSLMVALRPGLMPVTFAGTGSLGDAAIARGFFPGACHGGDCTEAGAAGAGMSSNNQRSVTGVMGTVTHFRLPTPVKIASADCPAPMEWTPVAAPVEM